MAHHAPLFADEKTAGQLLCMKPTEFRRLVGLGHLPAPKVIGGLERWDVEELQKVVRGDAVYGMSGVQW